MSDTWHVVPDKGDPERRAARTAPSAGPSARRGVRYAAALLVSGQGRSAARRMATSSTGQDEDIDLVLALMTEVLNEVFQSPARVTHAKAKRDAKKAAQAAATPQQRGANAPELPTISQDGGASPPPAHTNPASVG
ncbi:hypothetical protein GCM10023170_017910 [Phytohabitans houttuyneae]|uniref:Uncharacterized protein n=1 Tax=Phytohabitans houttuyneae TaxID=1076126 RepID=A0A6V8KPK2_9ACTN|nr:hypothetical protein Phou_099540 [Phytohabitans houttuyneae]